MQQGQGEGGCWEAARGIDGLDRPHTCLCAATGTDAKVSREGGLLGSSRKPLRDVGLNLTPACVQPGEGMQGVQGEGACWVTQLG